MQDTIKTEADALAAIEKAKDNPPRPKTPEEARDEIAAMILDASTAYLGQSTQKVRNGKKRKFALTISERLADISERIAALTY